MFVCAKIPSLMTQMLIGTPSFLHHSISLFVCVLSAFQGEVEEGHRDGTGKQLARMLVGRTG